MQKLLLSVALVLSAGNLLAMFNSGGALKRPIQTQTIDLSYTAAQRQKDQARYDQLKAKPITVRTVAEQNEMDTLYNKLYPNASNFNVLG